MLFRCAADLKRPIKTLHAHLCHNHFASGVDLEHLRSSLDRTSAKVLSYLNSRSSCYRTLHSSREHSLSLKLLDLDSSTTPSSQPPSMPPKLMPGPAATAVRSRTGVIPTNSVTTLEGKKVSGLLRVSSHRVLIWRRRSRLESTRRL